MDAYGSNSTNIGFVHPEQELLSPPQTPQSSFVAQEPSSSVACGSKLHAEESVQPSYPQARLKSQGLEKLLAAGSAQPTGKLAKGAAHKDDRPFTGMGEIDDRFHHWNVLPKAATMLCFQMLKPVETRPIRGQLGLDAASQWASHHP